MANQPRSSSLVCSAGGIMGTAATRAAVYRSAIRVASPASAFRTRRSSSVRVTDHLQSRSEVVGVRRLVLDVVSRAWMLEAESHRVQPLPRQSDPLGEGRI